MSDTSERSSPGPLTLVLRAVFVPDGEQPPLEFSSVFELLKFRATLDTATGIITCDNAGMSFDGDIRAEWHPDPEQGAEGGEDGATEGGDARTGQNGDAQGTAGSGEGSPTQQDNPPSVDQTGGHRSASPASGPAPFQRVSLRRPQRHRRWR